MASSQAMVKLEEEIAELANLTRDQLVGNRPVNLTYRATDGPVTLRPQRNAMARTRRAL